jgi:hypothetical protein
MNVDTFSNDPEIKWFFISAVPMMVVVLISYFIFKYRLARARQTPYSRGIYEHLFQDLSNQYPILWSRAGPRENVKVKTWWQRIQWALIQKWNEPSKTIQNTIGRDEDQFDGLGSWSRCKRLLTRRWTAEINSSATLTPPNRNQISIEKGHPSVVEDLQEVVFGTDINGPRLQPVVPPAAPHLLQVPNELNVRVNSAPPIFNQRFSVASSVSGRRSSHESQGSSGIMIEEQKKDWLCE